MNRDYIDWLEALPSTCQIAQILVNTRGHTNQVGNIRSRFEEKTT